MPLILCKSTLKGPLSIQLKLRPLLMMRNTIFYRVSNDMIGENDNTTKFRVNLSENGLKNMLKNQERLRDCNGRL